MFARREESRGKGRRDKKRLRIKNVLIEQRWEKKIRSILKKQSILGT